MKKLIENLFELQTLERGAAGGAGASPRIAELRALVPAQILGHYDRLLARGKKGVSVIKGQVCGECHVQVPRNTVLTLMNNADIQICENCGRYLCLPENVNPAVPPQPAPKKVRKNAAKRPALVTAA